MMGRQNTPPQMFYDFRLDDHVPAGHLLRKVDAVLDIEAIRPQLAALYSPIGRPSIDPELMIRMLLVGYLYGIRSETRLCEELHLNLAYRWFCGLGLDGRVPDRSSFSKNRHGRFRDCDLFRHLFESVVAQCSAEGVVGGETFATDASIIQADANKQYSAPKADWETAQIDPAVVPRAVREYLETLDDAAFGAASQVTPKFTSFSDPASQWTGALKGPAFFAYSTNYLIDTDHAIILDVEATRAIRSAEVVATQTMLTRTRDRFDLFPDRLAADTAYGSGNMLGWLVDQDIEPHVPVIDKSDRKDGTFTNLEFRYDPATDEYTCPGGKPLKKYWRKMRTARTGVSKDGIKRYYASKTHSSTCALKERCTPNKDARIVSRHVHEAARDKAREIAKTDAYADASRRRKKVEMLFAHLKKIMRLDRLRLRGPNGAKDEFLLAATAQNLRKLAKLRPMGPATT